MTQLDTVLAWSRRAPRGAKARLARHLGWPPQRLSNTLAVARAGRQSPDVARLAAALESALGAEAAVDTLVVAATKPTRLSDLVAAVVSASGAPAALVAEVIRERYMTVRNMFDQHEYVFAALVGTGVGKTNEAVVG